MDQNHSRFMSTVSKKKKNESIAFTNVGFQEQEQGAEIFFYSSCLAKLTGMVCFSRKRKRLRTVIKGVRQFSIILPLRWGTKKFKIVTEAEIFYFQSLIWVKLHHWILHSLYNSTSSFIRPFLKSLLNSTSTMQTFF